MPSIFEVDKAGLAKLLERRGIEWLLYELYQNAVDAVECTFVDIHVEPVAGCAKAIIEIVDNSPLGFNRLSDAYTLFAESEKKGDAEKRGRFNLGEKLVIALCEWCEIDTTTGSIRFDELGRTLRRGRKREEGTRFKAQFKCTREQLASICDAAKRLIVPQGVAVKFNYIALPQRTPVAIFDAELATEVGDSEGVLRRCQRKTTVNVYEVLDGETASIYEMGIPVVETSDKFHYDVLQKVPLGLERDNVPPAYLRTLRTFALNATYGTLNTEEANATWARDGASDPRAENDAVAKVADLRFGEKRVSYDPSDPEANKIAMSKGYTVVYGSMGSGGEWDNLRRAQAILPAGQVTPSAKPYGDGPMEKVLPESEWTSNMCNMAAYAKMLAKELMGVSISVKITRAGTNFMACYGSRQLTFNINGGCSHSFFGNVGSVRCDSLLLHEYGHEACGDHLSEEFYDALTDLGAKFKALALNKPGLLKDFMPCQE